MLLQHGSLISAQRIFGWIATGLLLAGCGAAGTPGSPSNAEPGDPTIGTHVGSQDVVGYFPPPKVGINYVYVGVEKKGETTKTTRAELEVLEVNGSKVKLKLTIAGESKTTDVDTSTPPVLPPGGLTFEGRESLSVPAGSFKAAKFSYSQNGSNFNVWAFKGVGVLKILEQRPNSDTNTVQLDSYRQ